MRHIITRVILLSILSLICLSSFSQKNESVNGSLLWSKVVESNIPSVGTRYIVPSNYRISKLNINKVSSFLNNVPILPLQDVNNSNYFIDIPLPEGGFERFRIIETPVIEATLQRSYVNIRTYTGSSLNNNGKTIKLDFTPQGFHAMILDANGSSIFIDPYSFGGGDIEHYIIYYKKHY